MNIAVQVVAFLRSQGVDVASVFERGLARLTDPEILDLASYESRFVLTHDADFGRLTIGAGQPFFGVLYLRPGDDPPAVVIESLKPLLTQDVDWTPPLLAVYGGGRLRLRRP